MKERRTHASLDSIATSGHRPLKFLCEDSIIIKRSSALSADKNTSDPVDQQQQWQKKAEKYMDYP